MSALFLSSQSAATRILVLVSIYALILVAYPFARHLTAVTRFPIDFDSIAAWSDLAKKTGCPVRIPARVSISYDPARDPLNQAWAAQILEETVALLQVGSEGRGDSGWCVQWHLNWTSSAENDEALHHDLSYAIDHVVAADSDIVLLDFNLTEPLTHFSPHSLAAALARQIATNLQLPHIALLLDDSGGTPTSQEAPGHGDAQPHAPEVIRLMAEGLPTSPPEAGLQSALSRHDYMDTFRETGEPTASFISRHAYQYNPEVEEIGEARSSHLLLQLHVLNEDMTISNFTRPPLGSDFLNRLQAELGPIQDFLQDVTELGYTAQWGIGKVARDVKWEAVHWTGTRAWEDTFTVAEETEVECELESVTEEHDAVTQLDGEAAQDSESVGPSPSAQSAPCLRTYNVTRQIQHSEDVAKTAFHLSRDQMEIFVDESAWGLDSPVEHHRDSDMSQFPFLFKPAPRVDVGSAIPASEVKTLHFVLYNPSTDHRPLFYSTSVDSVEEYPQVSIGETSVSMEGELRPDQRDLTTSWEEERRRRLVESAMEADGQETTWGWVVPSWGGVILLPSLSPSYDSDQEVVELLRDQLCKLLAIPAQTSVLQSGIGSARARERFHLKRLTILRRTQEAIETLESIRISLAKLSNLEVGPSVQSSVLAALQALQTLTPVPTEIVSTLLNSTSSSSPSPSPPLSLHQQLIVSLQAKRLASKAFFNPRLVGQLYFPAEHRYAVFTPFFGPLAVPLLLAVLKEVRKVLIRRRSRNTKGKKEKVAAAAAARAEDATARERRGKQAVRGRED